MKNPDRAVRSVLITGASSGIGRACAVRLAAEGWRVFGGVRRKEDAESLAAEPGSIQPVEFDVTDAEQSRTVAEQIGLEVGGAGLQGLVNNAGVAVGGPLEIVPMEEIRRQLEVNLVGTLAVTQPCLPLLRKGGGRIVNMGSIGGYIGFPIQGPYSASKFALEGLTNVLRQELRRQGIGVTLIAPGAVSTPIWKKSFAAWEEIHAGLSEAATDPWQGVTAASLRLVRKAERRAVPVEVVARAVRSALTKEKAPARIDVGRGVRLRRFVALFCADRFLDNLIHRALRREHCPEDGALPAPAVTTATAGRNVLVTGAAGGIGRSIVCQLASLGYRVFAGMLPGEMGEGLFDDCEGPVTSVVLDVTDPASISRARATVEEALGEEGLAGLINNAGILHYAPLEFLPLDEFRRMLEINLLGTLSVTRAFLPRLRAADGRIVNMGSAAGIFSLPMQGAYSSSKFGLEGMTDCLRRELAFQDLPVSIIEPVAVQTPMLSTAAEESRRLMTAMPAEAEELYGHMHRMLVEDLEGELTRALEPGAVTADVVHALEASRPRTRYLIGRRINLRWFLVRILPTSRIDDIVEKTLLRRHPEIAAENDQFPPIRSVIR
ncbi:SDR family NAD(P)-dependent oxidoreductase [Gemmatimonadota bacterium]